MLVKDLNIKTLNTGDKSARVTLESLRPDDIPELAKLNDQTEIIVEFTIDTTIKK